MGLLSSGFSLLQNGKDMGAAGAEGGGYDAGTRALSGFAQNQINENARTGLIYSMMQSGNDLLNKVR
ncbi:hypothetical protein LJR230_002191 [Trinickia sp. LjRoot230]|uniref:hypothetical protein n=1 Tax=Trinickia sp. LjRoot230 TaxID=3342288 RepID=UPI003ECC3D9D